MKTSEAAVTSERLFLGHKVKDVEPQGRHRPVNVRPFCGLTGSVRFPSAEMMWGHGSWLLRSNLPVHLSSKGDGHN